MDPKAFGRAAARVLVAIRSEGALPFRYAVGWRQLPHSYQLAANSIKRQQKYSSSKTLKSGTYPQRANRRKPSQI
jgi:hypothetical protein